MTPDQPENVSKIAALRCEMFYTRKQMTTIESELQQANSKWMRCAKFGIDCKAMMAELESVLYNETNLPDMVTRLKSIIQQFKCKYIYEMVDFNVFNEDVFLGMQVTADINPDFIEENLYAKRNDFIDDKELVSDQGFTNFTKSDRNICDYGDDSSDEFPWNNPTMCINGDEIASLIENEFTGNSFLHGSTEQTENYSNFHAGIEKKPFICMKNDCGKRFLRSTNLKRHMRTHDGLKPFVCDKDDCGMRFGLVGNLLRHKRNHTKKFTFVCNMDSCGKRFTRSSDVKRHQYTHTGDFPFVCDKDNCGKGFVRLDYLKKHKQYHAENDHLN